MRTESSLAPDGMAADPRRAWMSGRRRADVVAVVLLIALPAVVFGLPRCSPSYAPPGFAAALALSLMAGVLVTGFFVTALLAWPPVAAGLAGRVRKPVHRPRSPVSNPARMLQDR